MWAFLPEETDTYGVDDDHLARMLELICEPMPASLLRTELGSSYFNSSGEKQTLVTPPFSMHNLITDIHSVFAGDLTRIGPLHPVSIEATLTQTTSLTPKEIRQSADFIRACLRLDQDVRPTADQLQEHPWLLGACILMNYRPSNVVL